MGQILFYIIFLMFGNSKCSTKSILHNLSYVAKLAHFTPFCHLFGTVFAVREQRTPTANTDILSLFKKFPGQKSYLAYILLLKMIFLKQSVRFSLKSSLN